MIAPDVAIPPAMSYIPGRTYPVAHIRSSGIGRSVTRMKNSVVPYITIRSPGSVTPTLSASAAASTAPAVTGVPALSPVSSAPRSLTVPAISVDHIRSGNFDVSMIGSAKRSSYASASISTSGFECAPVCLSMTYSPVSRWIRYELAVRILCVRV